MKTVKTILERLTEAYDGGFQVDPTYSIDQALSEIQELLDGAKPEYMSPIEKGLHISDIDWRNGRCSSVAEYQDNIRKVMK